MYICVYLHVVRLVLIYDAYSIILKSLTMYVCALKYHQLFNDIHY